MKLSIKPLVSILLITAFSCSNNKQSSFNNSELASLDLLRGNIALCGDGTFGDVSMSFSCSPLVRDDFNLALALLHSFEYDEAEKAFVKVIDQTPDCAMAYWGVAMSNFHPLWYPPSEKDLKKGTKVLEIANSIEPISKKDSEYLQALMLFYKDWEELDHATRVNKYEQAMEQIYKNYPDDKEAAVLYTLAINATIDPKDKTFAKQKKAGEILMNLFPDQPKHPGIAHYLIHNYDYPELAEIALPAARQYAIIASSAAHALHMPSHIFTRLGLWDESIESNNESMDASLCYIESVGIDAHWSRELHAMDYLIYAYLQQAQDVEAKELNEYLKTIFKVYPGSSTEAYTFAAVPVRYALEQRNWEDAAKLELHPVEFQWEKYLWQKAIVYFARALGAANTGDLNAAKTDLEELKTISNNLAESGESYQANQVNIQINAAQAWIHLAEGNHDKAIELMTLAANMEDATNKHPVTPGEVLPARELLGDMYMKIEKLSEALEAYELSMKRHQNRFNGVYGAGLSAEKSGDFEKATKYYRQLLGFTVSSDNNRPQLIAAKVFLDRL